MLEIVIFRQLGTSNLELVKKQSLLLVLELHLTKAWKLLGTLDHLLKLILVHYLAMKLFSYWNFFSRWRTIIFFYKFFILKYLFQLFSWFSLPRLLKDHLICSQNQVLKHLLVYSKSFHPIQILLTIKFVLLDYLQSYLEMSLIFDSNPLKRMKNRSGDYL